VDLAVSTLWHQLNHWGLTYKNTHPRTTRPDVQAERERLWQTNWESGKMVFLNETDGSNGYDPLIRTGTQGEHCLAHAPTGQWKTTTFVAGLQVNGFTATLILNDPMNGEAFLAYIRDFLYPTLKAADVIVLDNLSCHKVSGVQEAIETTGASLLYLPTYSPDLNPIETAFAKLKALLAQECANYFQAAGYHPV
jgi:transposase